MKAKKISRDYNSYSRQDWERIRFKVMRWCLEVKLIQNFDKFSSLLLATGEKSIVEYSNTDKVWGATPSSPNKLTGVNALGRLLMEVREKIKNETLHSESIIYPLDIPAFLLFNNKIKEVHNDAYFIGDLDDIYAY